MPVAPKRQGNPERRTANDPVYRIEITAKSDSAQHQMLIELDAAPNLVFYAAPTFHRKEEFDAAFTGGRVRQRSFFVRPRTIGAFSDNGPHYLSFDGSTCVIMSEPKIIEALGAAELAALLRSRLEDDQRPLRETVDEAVREAETARARSRERLRGRDQLSAVVDVGAALEFPEEAETAPAIEDFRARQDAAQAAAPPPKVPDDPNAAALRRLADIGLREFNAQLYIVQDREGD